ncbi:transcriptional regulator [Micromonospora sp. ATA51]|uniref:transcriptional regulator n=1 Tax=Micromonospora sp. ATA51 TaxID=2806098 RepID=UPI001EE437E6|nr:transcriptional regulator [Micromonospora sp. ATA51]
MRFDATDRAFLAALLHRLPRDVLREVRLLVRPDTVLRWHRDQVTRRHAARSRSKRPGRPRAVRSIRTLALRLARENPSWGYRRIHGELLVLGVKVAASTVWEILKEAGIDPAPERASSTWADFLRSRADALLACDFLETVTLTGARMYVLAVIEHGSRRVRILGATPHPTAVWTVQAAKNLVMDLEDASYRARFMIRDRDGKFPALFDAVVTESGIEIVRSGVRMPRMNSVMERWVQTCENSSTGP